MMGLQKLGVVLCYPAAQTRLYLRFSIWLVLSRPANFALC